MPKVRCKDCLWWYNSQKTIIRRLYYFDFLNPIITVGSCDNEKVLDETSGYTGVTSGHKGRREGEVLRYCSGFKPKVAEVKE